ncbi:EAL domain-containing protein [Thiomicrorhabdus sp. ZW0627]|uniref:EAL domain-containing protein n=1 Tax=Thiomicrorhabdus sp. ZW0627 TaxID=3039774 RepID=UPI0024362DB2|nr:EAL domain-containing protein [Thiomicrorhabdus sp. ZW0627]MDG6773808.1 EAL domain-containing protein [Thiomicrorhabdus sp. ZW0627]
MNQHRVLSQSDTHPRKWPFLVFWLGLLFLILATLSVLYYYQSREIEKHTLQQLEDISHFKVAHIHSWLNERKGDARTYSQHEKFIEQIQHLKKDSFVYGAMLSRFKAFIEAYGYDEVTLFDAQGRVLIDVNESGKGSNPEIHNGVVKKALSNPEGVKTELFIDHKDFHLDIVAPLVDSVDVKSPKVVGVLVLHINPKHFLMPFIKDWPVETQTGENVLIARYGNQVMRLNRLRFKTDGSTDIFQLKHPKETLKKIFRRLDQGDTEGFLSIIDYRHHPAFIFYQKIDDTNWVLVSKIDRDEVYKPLYQLLFWGVLVGSIALIMTAYGLMRIFNGEQARRNAERIEERQAFLEASQNYFISLFMNAPIAYLLLNRKGDILDVNQAWCDLLGYCVSDVIGKHYSEFLCCDLSVSDEGCELWLDHAEVHPEVVFSIRCGNGVNRHVSLHSSVSEDMVTHEERIHCLLTDITEKLQYEASQKRILQRTQALFELMLKAPNLDESELLKMAMDKIEALSDSRIGFVHFVNEDQNTIEFVTWSSNTLDHHCTAMYDSHYPVEKAGIWADCVRKREPVIINDYATVENKQGVPEGHSDLKRFVCIPILNQGLVKMIIGVGNADQDYDEFDVESIQLFGSELYQIVLLKRAYDDLNLSEKRFHELFAKAPVAYQSLNEQGQIVEINEAWLRMFGFDIDDVEKVAGRSITEFMTNSHQNGFERAFSQFLKRGKLHQQYFRIVRQDGVVRDIEVTGQTSLTYDNHLRTHCMLLDITEKLQTEKSLKLSAKVFEHAGEGIMVTDPQRRIVSINQAFTDILGYTEEEVLGQTPRILHSGKHPEEFYKQLWDELIHKGFWQGEIWNRNKRGELIPEWLTITELKNESGEVENYIGVFADISKVKASEAELDFISYHDVMTALPNRQKFMVNLEYAIQHSKRREMLFAVLMLDLDRFKEVNDSFGHGAGDEVLMDVAKILKEHTRETDFVARFGGDEFAILLDDLKHADDAARIARNLIEAISEPITLTGQKQTVSVGCSIGISLFPDHGDDPDVLMQHADSALYLSKQKKSGSFEYFNTDMTHKAQERISIEVELKNAIKNNELRVFYQPQIELSSGEMIGAEALVRWQHPEQGLVSPAYFIGVAEESGLIADIGEWVLKETCRQVKQWSEQGYKELVFAVNVSPKQLVYRDMLATVMQVLSETELPAEMLELEITESGLLTLGEDAVQLFDQLRGLGVRIAIDDFGTGYSSLAYLKSLPLDVLKIDKQFVDDIPHDEAGMQIVNSIISMGHNLHLSVLAEGVETEFQREFLRLKGCDYYQGYLTSPPVDAQRFERQFLQKDGRN